MDTRISQCAQFTESPELSVWGDMDMGMLSGGFRPVLAKSHDFDWSKSSYLDSYWPAVVSGRHVPVSEGPMFNGSLYFLKIHS